LKSFFFCGRIYDYWSLIWKTVLIMYLHCNYLYFTSVCCVNWHSKFYIQARNIHHFNFIYLFQIYIQIVMIYRTVVVVAVVAAGWWWCCRCFCFCFVLSVFVCLSVSQSVVVVVSTHDTYRTHTPHCNNIPTHSTNMALTHLHMVWPLQFHLRDNPLLLPTINCKQEGRWDASFTIHFMRLYNKG
jgi:hypothetical protein